MNYPQEQSTHANPGTVFQIFTGLLTVEDSKKEVCAVFRRLDEMSGVYFDDRKQHFSVAPAVAAVVSNETGELKLTPSGLFKFQNRLPQGIRGTWIPRAFYLNGTTGHVHLGNEYLLNYETDMYGMQDEITFYKDVNSASFVRFVRAIVYFDPKEFVPLRKDECDIASLSMKNPVTGNPVRRMFIKFPMLNDGKIECALS